MADKTVAEKLQIKAGYQVWLINPPENYLVTLGPLPAGACLVEDPTGPVDFIQLFVAGQKDLEARLGEVKSRLKPKGLLWISYHKGTSKVKTDINRDTIGAFAKGFGLEPNYMISVDEDWSAMRFKRMEVRP